MKRKLFVPCILTVCLLCSCGNSEAEQTVIEVSNKYTQMYYDTWQNLPGKAENDTVYQFAGGFDYMKLNEEITSIEQVKKQTEQICTKNFAEKKFYEKLLERDAPLLYEQDEDLFLLVAEMPGLIIGEIKEVDILEKKDDYIRAEILGQDLALGETITDIVIVKQDGIWKVDSLESDLKADK